MSDGTMNDDALPAQLADLTPSQLVGVAAMIVASDERDRRARAVHGRLKALLATEHLQVLWGRDRATQWDDPRLAALEALVALLPRDFGDAPTKPCCCPGQ